MKKLLLSITLLLISVSSFADSYKEFKVGDDTWVIKTSSTTSLITLCLLTTDNCTANGIGIREDYDYKGDGLTAREYYTDFLLRAENKLTEYYESTGVDVPSENEFVAFLDYLIQHGTSYNESSNTFTITR